LVQIYFKYASFSTAKLVIDFNSQKSIATNIFGYTSRISGNCKKSFINLINKNSPFYCNVMHFSAVLLSTFSRKYAYIAKIKQSLLLYVYVEVIVDKKLYSNQLRFEKSLSKIDCHAIMENK